MKLGEINHLKEKDKHYKFLKQASKERIDQDRLPPTEDASTEHAYRIHHQLITFKKHIMNSVSYSQSLLQS